jgi:hypothetical protein
MSYLPPEQILVAYLFGTCGLRGVSVEDPQDMLSQLPWAKVTRVGGSSDYVTDNATVDVDVFDTDRTSALTAASKVHARMLAMRGTRVSGCVVDDVEVLMSPRWVDYDDEHTRRYVATYVISSRLGIPLSVVSS